jgi:hypothetical protein
MRDTLTGDMGLLASNGVGAALVLLPKGTDIRPVTAATQPDVVEAPLGSGLYHRVIAVNDRWKGFPNEYRIALVEHLSHLLGNEGGPWWVFPQP